MTNVVLCCHLIDDPKTEPLRTWSEKWHSAVSIVSMWFLPDQVPDWGFSVLRQIT